MALTSTLRTSRITRRSALHAGGLGAVVTLADATWPRAAAQEFDVTPDLDGLSAGILERLETLPGTKGLMLWVPPDAGRPEWKAVLNADQELFIASAFKSIVLAAYLLQIEDSLDPASSTP